MAAASALQIAAELVSREADCLDRRDWDAWLGLYREDAVFWVPAWRNESELVEDPDAEVSLIYHDSRLGLQERVARLRSQKTATAQPPLRTTHLVTTLHAGPAHGGIDAASSFCVMSYNARTAAQNQLFGRYVHRLVEESNGWRIASKKIMLMNDRVPTLLDFYCL